MLMGCLHSDHGERGERGSEGTDNFTDVIQESAPALAHFELGRVCGRGEDELLFRSEESLRLAEREESLQCEKRRLRRYGGRPLLTSAKRGGRSAR